MPDQSHPYERKSDLNYQLIQFSYTILAFNRLFLAIQVFLPYTVLAVVITE